MSNRLTVITGAGLPLNLNLDVNGKNYPSTENITKLVCQPYPDYSQSQQGKEVPLTNIVGEFRDYLIHNYPVKGIENTGIHFEQIFHCLEMYLSYSNSWSDKCHNESICPVFGPFTTPSIDFSRNTVSCVIPQLLLRIMDVINSYNEYFSAEKDGKEKWITDFFKGLPPSDIFNFNYDTIFEEIFEESGFEDGFMETKISSDYKVFNPQNLLDNPRNFHTINHLHGCINLYHADDFNSHVRELRHEDWVKFKDYSVVRRRMICRSQSQPYTQAGEIIYNGPIITGLNKTAKLNCLPFDFYHANLMNAIVRNHKLLIIGYGFGDLYCNTLIHRMNLIHGEKARVCIIDFWKVLDDSVFAFRNHSYSLSKDLGDTLCIYGDSTDYSETLAKLYPLGRKNMMKAHSGKLMLGINGLKTASHHAKEIYEFLNS